MAAKEHAVLEGKWRGKVPWEWGRVEGWWLDSRVK